MRKGLFILFGMALVLSTGVAQADDKEDVLAARAAAIAAWNAGDVDAIQKHYAPDFTRYGDRGNLLSGAWGWAGLKTWFESGGKVTVSQVRHTDVQVYGNTAIVTGYSRLNITRPDGTSRSNTGRNTGVWVKQNGQWKAVHQHASLLTPTQSE